MKINFLVIRILYTNRSTYEKDNETFINQNKTPKINEKKFYLIYPPNEEKISKLFVK